MNYKYLVLSNSDKKRWILNKNNLKVALCLYQPSSIKGKLLKKYLPLVNSIPIVNSIFYKLIRIEKTNLNEEDYIYSILERVLGKEKYDLSFFMGTPSSIHQKCTVQVSIKDNILAYYKFSSNEEIGNLFLKEKDTLDYLKSLNIENIPSCLFAGKDDKNNNVFVQTTIKTFNSVMTHSIGDRELSFLNELAKKTAYEIKYKNTDFYTDTLWLKNNLHFLKNCGLKTEFLYPILDSFLTDSEKIVRFGLSHGDFTPWNCFVEENKLFVFDFEYSKRSYPLFIDLFHFYTQSSIFERSMDAETIFKEYRNEKLLKEKITKYVKDPDELYSKYLISVISAYTQRDLGKFSKDNLDCVKVWIRLLELISGLK